MNREDDRLLGANIMAIMACTDMIQQFMPKEEVNLKLNQTLVRIISAVKDLSQIMMDYHKEKGNNFE